MEDAHAKTTEEVLKFFGTNDETGLTADQVKTNQAKYGLNGECHDDPTNLRKIHLFRLIGQHLKSSFALSHIIFVHLVAKCSSRKSYCLA